MRRPHQAGFPYFFVGTFIEAVSLVGSLDVVCQVFPYFFVGTFIEANFKWLQEKKISKFPYFFVGTFIEATAGAHGWNFGAISLLFRRDFH